jgi:hypothetical protein
MSGAFVVVARARFKLRSGLRLGQRKNLHLPREQISNARIPKIKRQKFLKLKASGRKCMSCGHDALTAPRCSFPQVRARGTGAGNHQGEAWERNLDYGLLAPGVF